MWGDVGRCDEPAAGAAQPLLVDAVVVQAVGKVAARLAYETVQRDGSEKQKVVRQVAARRASHSRERRAASGGRLAGAKLEMLLAALAEDALPEEGRDLAVPVQEEQVPPRLVPAADARLGSEAAVADRKAAQLRVDVRVAVVEDLLGELRDVDACVAFARQEERLGPPLWEEVEPALERCVLHGRHTLIVPIAARGTCAARIGTVREADRRRPVKHHDRAEPGPRVWVREEGGYSRPLEVWGGERVLVEEEWAELREQAKHGRGARAAIGPEDRGIGARVQLLLFLDKYVVDVHRHGLLGGSAHVDVARVHAARKRAAPAREGGDLVLRGRREGAEGGQHHVGDRGRGLVVAPPPRRPCQAHQEF